MHPSSYALCSQFVQEYLFSCPKLRIADVGSYDLNGTYRALFVRPGWKYVGFDLDAGPNVDVVLESSEDWNLQPEHIGAYDVVISGQVLEHVQRPWRWIHQFAKLCRSSGIVWLCAPNTWQFHEHPIDCWRIWPDGMKALLEDAEIDVIQCMYLGTDTVGIGRKTGRSAGSSSNVAP